MPAGRPSAFSPEIGASICERLIEGESLRVICRSEGMPAASTVFLWLGSHPEFSEQYTRARNMQADLQFDEIIEICDDGQNDYMEKLGQDGEQAGRRENGEAIRRSVLRVDTRKWRMSKMLPKKYGDKLDLNHSGAIETEDLDFSHLPKDERAVMKELLLKAKALKDAAKKS